MGAVGGCPNYILIHRCVRFFDLGPGRAGERVGVWEGESVFWMAECRLGLQGTISCEFAALKKIEHTQKERKGGNVG